MARPVIRNTTRTAAMSGSKAMTTADVVTAGVRDAAAEILIFLTASIVVMADLLRAVAIAIRVVLVDCPATVLLYAPCRHAISRQNVHGLMAVAHECAAAPGKRYVMTLVVCSGPNQPFTARSDNSDGRREADIVQTSSIYRD